MNDKARAYLLNAASHLENFVEQVGFARDALDEVWPDIDHLVDEDKFLLIADWLRQMAEAPAEDHRIFTEGKIS
jgi:hypothetical protein